MNSLIWDIDKSSVKVNSCHFFFWASLRFRHTYARPSERVWLCVSGWSDCEGCAEVSSRDGHVPLHHRTSGWEPTYPALPHCARRRDHWWLPEPTFRWETRLQRPDLPGANLLEVPIRIHVQRIRSVKGSMNAGRCSGLSSSWHGVTVFIGSAVLWPSVQEFVDCDFFFFYLIWVYMDS